MRIVSIKLRNYRQFRDCDFAFPKGRQDIHVLIGRNGSGKTNLLNAINWCLYQKEPHLTDISRALPLPHAHTVQSARDGAEIRVTVEVRLETTGDAWCEIVRCHVFRVQKRQAAKHDTHFQVRVGTPAGDVKLLDGEEASGHVAKLLPEDIREYFFFDGERLDGYFKEEAGQRIRNAVFQISQIDILAAVERRLIDLVREYEREAGKKSPQIKELAEAVEKAETRKSIISRDLDECVMQLAAADKGVTEFAEKLRGLPDVEKLERERAKLGSDLGTLKDLISSREAERASMLYEYGVLLSVLPAIERALGVIGEKRRNGEIPPPVSSSLIGATLEKDTCLLCGRRLDESARKHVGALRERLRLASEAANALQRIEGPLQMRLNDATGFQRQRERIAHELGQIRMRETEAISRREAIEGELGNYDTERVREWAKTRKQFEEAGARLREGKGRLQAELQGTNRDVEELTGRLTAQMRQLDQAKELRKQVAFCVRAKDAAVAAKVQIMAEVRAAIEAKTCDVFQRLIWKKATYEGVEIDDSYNIRLNHAMGFNAIGSASAAERELLALSFTLALHDVSGFDSPLVIDTPVARVSDTNRENFGAALCEVARSGKQIILLFTPDEYSENISKSLDLAASTRRRLSLNKSEREVLTEDL